MQSKESSKSNFKIPKIKFTELFINGEFVDSVSGKTFETIDPRNEEVIASIAEGDKDDVDLAVKAAREAFENGPWPRLSAKKDSTVILVDNQAAIAISNNPVFHKKTNHFNIKFYFLREVQQKGEVTLVYCKSENQQADLFTKPLPVSKFELLRQKIGVCSSQSKEC